MVYIRHFILLSLAVVVVFSGCKKITPGGDKSYGDSLVILTYHAPSGINPLTSISGISAMLTEIVFDGLVRIDEELKPRPALASSWQVSKEGLGWTFFLRRGVKFHDGVELTSEDVKFTLEEIIRSGSITPYFGRLSDIRSIHIKDRYTVEIILNRPSISFIYNMAVGIIPIHLLGENEAQKRFGIHPVGTGPFKISSWKNNEIVFESNKDYFRGRPYLDSIIVRIYPDQEMAWARLMRGEGDILLPIDPAVYDFMKQVSSLKMYKTYGLHYSIIALNNTRNLFDDRRVRMALNYAINKEYITENVLKGKGKEAAGTIWYGSWAYNPAIKPYPYDPQKAMSLLNDAGWMDRDRDHILDKDGKKFSFTLLINEGDEIKERAAMTMQQELWELGVLMSIKTLSTASTDFLFEGNYDAVYIDIFSHIYPDFNYHIWHSSQRRQGFNICRYNSALVDKLLEKGRTSRDIDEARPIYYRFQQEIHDNPPSIFLYWADRLVGLHNRFQGVKFPPIGALSHINEWYVPVKEQKYRR